MSVFPRRPRSCKIFNKKTVLVDNDPPYVVHLMQSSRPLCRLRGIGVSVIAEVLDTMHVTPYQRPTCLYCIGVS